MRRTNARRRGISLGELLVAISAVAILIGLSTRMIHRVMHAHSKATAFQRGEQQALRLSSQFRRDVHAASTAVIDDLQGAKILQLTDDQRRQVEYRMSEQSLVRTTSRNTASSQQDAAPAREEFMFPGNVAFQIEKLEAPPRLALVIETQTHSRPNPPPRGAGAGIPSVPFAMRIEACLARDSAAAVAPTPKENAP